MKKKLGLEHLFGVPNALEFNAKAPAKLEVRLHQVAVVLGEEKTRPDEISQNLETVTTETEHKGTNLLLPGHAR
jgi:hypothetical protein